MPPGTQSWRWAIRDVCREPGRGPGAEELWVRGSPQSQSLPFPRWGCRWGCSWDGRGSWSAGGVVWGSQLLAPQPGLEFPGGYNLGHRVGTETSSPGTLTRGRRSTVQVQMLLEGSRGRRQIRGRQGPGPGPGPADRRSLQPACLEAQAGLLIRPRDLQEGWKQGGPPRRGDTQTEYQITSRKLPFEGGECLRHKEIGFRRHSARGRTG